jgi:hypothetical protein
MLKLCYAEDGFAYFTNAALAAVTGDDWHRPCCSPPYDEYVAAVIAWVSDTREIIMGRHGDRACPYPVWSPNDTNVGMCCWICGRDSAGKLITIHGGSSVKDFIIKMTQLDCTLLFPRGFKFPRGLPKLKGF